jgi:hypothetical protein
VSGPNRVEITGRRPAAGGGDEVRRGAQQLLELLGLIYFGQKLVSTKKNHQTSAFGCLKPYKGQRKYFSLVLKWVV